jgi:transposase-like protein
MNRYEFKPWHEEALRLARTGEYTQSDIARRVGMTRERVRQVLRREGFVGLTKKDSAAIVRRRKWTPEYIAEIQAEVDRVGIAEAARKFGHNASYLRERGILGRNRDASLVTDVCVEMYVEEERSTKEIGRLLGLKQSSVYERIARRIGRENMRDTREAASLYWGRRRRG